MSETPSFVEPQLRMIRPDLHDLPPLDVPAGYVLRHYRPGDDEGLTDTLKDAFARDEMAFGWAVRNNRGFMPERSWLIQRDDGLIVASASMLMDPDSALARQSGTAFLHWVAGRKGEAGKKLGYWVCLAVMYRMLSEGFSQAGLGTDDDRLPAIKTYLNLGYEPSLVHENQRDRWRKVFENLHMADEAQRRFGHLLAGPLGEF